jgi:hypothetical protein
VQGLAVTKPQGIEIGDALMGDGRTVRFKVVARNPVSVQAINANAQPGDAEAIAAWLAGQGREA